MRKEVKIINWTDKALKGVIILGAAAGFVFFQSPLKAIPSSDNDVISANESIEKSNFSAKCGDGKCGGKDKKTDAKKDTKSSKSSDDKCGAKEKKSNAKCDKSGDDKCGAMEKKADAKKDTKSSCCGDS